MWLATKQKLSAVRLTIKGPVERETNRIADEVKAFETGVEAFRERFLADAVLTPAAATRNPYEVLDRLNAEQHATEQGARELRKLTELFEFPEIMETIDEITVACRTDLALAKKLWDTAFVVQTQLAEWEATRWADFETEPVEAELELLLRFIHICIYIYIYIYMCVFPRGCERKDIAQVQKNADKKACATSKNMSS